MGHYVTPRFEASEVVFSVEGFANASEARALKKLSKPLLNKSSLVAL